MIPFAKDFSYYHKAVLQERGFFIGFNGSLCITLSNKCPFVVDLTMRPNILPTFILCAILLMEANAQEQSSSGYGAEGSTSTDDGSGFDGSGSNTQDGEYIGLAFSLVLNCLKILMRAKPREPAYFIFGRAAQGSTVL